MWSYDERGNRTSEASRESAPAVAVSWTYDRADRMTSRSADGATVSYAYDAAGDLISASGPTGHDQHRGGRPRAAHRRDARRRQHAHGRTPTAS